MDYDVAVTGLSSPPPSAVLTTYRPAVSIRNNGLHDALASGYVRVYSAGLLIFESEVFSGTLAPGATGTADAVDYWTPDTEGTYVVQGYVSTPLDQVEPNNNLAPVTVIVAGGEPPEPPVVPLHAAQHEEGGTDPINVDGLHGVLTDRQLPSAHGTQHQAGQSDVLNVAGLAGVLGDPQTPIVHGNAHHNPDMSTAAELTAHTGATSAHSAATNLANRDTTGPLTGKLTDTQLYLGTTFPEDPADDPYAMGLRLNRFMGYTNPAHHAHKHNLGGLDALDFSASRQAAYPTVLIGRGTIATDITASSFPAAESIQHLIATLTSFAALTTLGGVGQQIRYRIDYRSNGTTWPLVTITLPLAANTTYNVWISGLAALISGPTWRAALNIILTDTAAISNAAHHIAQLSAAVPALASPGTIALVGLDVSLAVGSSASHQTNTAQVILPA